MNFKSIGRLIDLKIKLKLTRKKAILFGIPYGEFQFIKNIIIECEERLDYPIVLAHESNESFVEFQTIFTKTRNKFFHIKLRDLSIPILSNKEVAVYLTSDGLGIDDIYSIYTFHGQPSKGLTFTHGKIEYFDEFFLYGPLQKDALEHYLKNYYDNKKPSHLTLSKIGYTKSDDALNGKWVKSVELSKLDLPRNKLTVLYAPAFNEGASLREYGLQIINMLCEDQSLNVIAKLPIDCLNPATNRNVYGSVDWQLEINKLESKYSNFRLYKHPQVDPMLIAADILITCVSSISFEFLVLGKPVVFIDTPKFYSKYLKKIIKDINVEEWEKLPFVNGGKKFGTTVDKPADIIPAIKRNRLSTPNMYSIRKRLLYNPGRASLHAALRIENIIQNQLKPNKKFLYKMSLNARIKSIVSK